jgi:dihydrofolate reductase
VLLGGSSGGVDECDWLSWGIEKAEVTVTKVCVDSLSISTDGFGAGPDQNEEHPLRVGGRALHDWIFATKTGRSMIGEHGGSEGVDDAMFRRNLDGEGSVLMGRNMFGPLRGPWHASQWRGWWDDDPPFRRPLFVLTHFERPDLIMGDTTFCFVTGGLDEALRRARHAAGSSLFVICLKRESSTSYALRWCRSDWGRASDSLIPSAPGLQAMRCATRSSARVRDTSNWCAAVTDVIDRVV